MEKFDSIMQEQHGKGKTTYIISKCRGCGATIMQTYKDRMELAKLGNTLLYFDKNVPCCEKPDYTYMID
jgi:hypothetical protein